MAMQVMHMHVWPNQGNGVHPARIVMLMILTTFAIPAVTSLRPQLY
jgi:hypothetical protein